MMLNEAGARMYRERLEALLLSEHELRPNELKFAVDRLEALQQGDLRLSVKQRDWLDGIFERFDGTKVSFHSVETYSHDYYVAKTWAMNKPKRRK